MNLVSSDPERFLEQFPTWRLFFEQFLVGNESFQFVSYFWRLLSSDFKFWVIWLGFSKQMNFQTNTRKVAIYLLLLSENQKFVDSVLSRVLSSVFSLVCFSSVSSVLTKLLRLESTGFIVFWFFLKVDICKKSVTIWKIRIPMFEINKCASKKLVNRDNRV